MCIASPKRLQLAADVRIELVRDGGTWFQRIVMRYNDVLRVQLAAMNFDHLVLHDERIVVKIVVR